MFTAAVLFAGQTTHAQEGAWEIEDEDDAPVERQNPGTSTVPGDPSSPPSSEGAPASDVSTTPAQHTEPEVAPPAWAPLSRSPSEDLDALRREVEALRSRLDALDKEAPTAPPDPAADTPAEAPLNAAPSPTAWPREGVPLSDDVRLLGYIQAQYRASDLSEDELQQGGAPLNQDTFSLRRARLRILGEFDFARFDVELDANTTRGLSLGVRRAEGGILWRNPEEDAPPWVALSVGVTDVPFGYELAEPQDQLLFMERSAGSRAFFGGQSDVGAKLYGGVSFFRWAVAIMGGRNLTDTVGVDALDPTSDPDFSGRLGVEASPIEDFEIAGGVSFLYGTGFSAGSTASKDAAQWQDYNENAAIDTGELVSVPGRAARSSETFERWGIGADLRISGRTPIGWTRVWAEATLATNLDRTWFVADPVFAGRDIREVSAMVGFVQELTRYAFVGFRYDYYDPDSDFLDDRQGVRLVVDASVQTLSPLVGLAWPGVARLSFQYDVIMDMLARDSRGVATDLDNDGWTMRLQVGF